MPAVSAALRRLTTALGAPLIARRGRGITLTERGSRLVADVRPHLDAMIAAAVAPPRFDPKTSERTMRLGLADSAEGWLLPSLLKLLEKEAPSMRLICLPIQFRTVGDALATRRIDLAVTVADDLPRTIARKALFYGGFVCLYDPRHAKLGPRPSERTYFAHEHVIVSYNGDLRGIVEDLLQKSRRTRCSVTSFANIAAIVENSALLATVPRLVARAAIAQRPQLGLSELPFRLAGADTELLWPSATDDDEACAFLRACVVEVVEATGQRQRSRRAAPGE